MLTQCVILNNENKQKMLIKFLNPIELKKNSHKSENVIANFFINVCFKNKIIKFL